MSVKDEVEKSINVSYGLMEKDLTDAVKSERGGGEGTPRGRKVRG